MADEFRVLSIKPFPDLDWDDIEVPEPVARASVAQQAEEDDDEVILTPEQMAREQKRLASIAARRAESAMLDAERKAREEEKAEKKRKEEEEEAERRARALASAPKKSDYELEKEAFIRDFIVQRKEQDRRTGKGHLWIQRIHQKTKSAKTSEGEVKASQDAEHAWKTHKKI